MRELDFYLLDMKYIRALAKSDDNVMSVSPQTGKQTRPFLGVIILLNGKNYCIPLTSPKQKFQKSSGVDFIKIFDTESSLNNGNNKLIGVLNINNMIPVASSVIQKYNIVPTANDTPQKRAEKRLRAKQLNWCREHSDTIYNRANKVYKIVTETPEKSRNLVRRCCDFKKLELVLDKYILK